MPVPWILWVYQPMDTEPGESSPKDPAAQQRTPRSQHGGAIPDVAWRTTCFKRAPLSNERNGRWVTPPKIATSGYFWSRMMWDVMVEINKPFWVDRIGSITLNCIRFWVFFMSIMKTSYLLRWCIPPWMEFMPLNMHSYFSALLLASWLMGFPWGFRYMSLKWWGFC